MKEIKTAKPQDFDTSNNKTKDNKDNKEYNLIKKTAKELGMTYKELGEAIGISEGRVRQLAVSEVGEQVEKACLMLLKIQNLELKLSKQNQLKNLLNDFLS